MPSLLELQDLYKEALVREIIEKTKAAGVVWNHLGGTQFKATEVQDNPAPTSDVTWDFYVTKTQIGNLTYKYTMDIKKDSVAYMSIESGALPNTARDSAVKDLYEIVEVIVLQLDTKLKDTIQFVQGIADARD